MILQTGLICVALAMLLCGCTVSPGSEQTKNRKTVTIAGSTSVMPFTEKLAEHFMVDQHGFFVDVQGGGSTAGIQAVMNNTVDVGMSSRELKDDEKLLGSITICYDGISVVVHPDNPITGLTKEQVAAIFAGRIRNWKSLGWVDRQIDAVTREEGSGTRGSFEDLVMKRGEISDAIMVQDSNGSVKEVVATDPYAIGYISLGLVDKKVKPLSVDGVIPSVRNIKVGKYGIVRKFLYVVSTEPQGNARKFIDFVLSKDGQNILKKEGLVGFYD